MLPRAARLALLRDMSAAWQELNLALQIIGEGVNKSTIFGHGRPRDPKKRTRAIKARELLGE